MTAVADVTDFDLDIEIVQASVPTAEEIKARPFATPDSEVRVCTGATTSTIQPGLVACLGCCG